MPCCVGFALVLCLLLLLGSLFFLNSKYFSLLSVSPSLPEMEQFKYEIQAAKPLVDTSTPAIYSHLHVKLEKLKLQEDRLSIIERDNCLLLEMSSCIMRTKGRIDNKNYYKAKSLNGEKRKQELQRVNQENCAILDRITKSQPQYQVQRWHEDWQRAEKYMANIARYPRGRCKSQS